MNPKGNGGGFERCHECQLPCEGNWQEFQQPVQPTVALQPPLSQQRWHPWIRAPPEEMSPVWAGGGLCQAIQASTHRYGYLLLFQPQECAEGFRVPATPQEETKNLE